MLQFYDQIKSKQGFVDLHVHTNDSYGIEYNSMNLTPEELLESVYLYTEKNNCPATFALTDHNNINGNKKILDIINSDKEKYKNVHFIPGCEFTCNAASLGTIINSEGHIKSIFSKFHVLAYGFDVNNEGLLFLSKLHSTEFKNIITVKTNKGKLSVSAGAYVMAIKVILKDHGYDFPLSSFYDVNLTTIGFKEQTYINYLLKYIKKFALPEDVMSEIEIQLQKRNLIDLGRVDVMEVMNLVESAGGHCVLAHPALLKVGKTAINSWPDILKKLRPYFRANNIIIANENDFGEVAIKYATHRLSKNASYHGKKLNGIVGIEALHYTSMTDFKRLNAILTSAKHGKLYLTCGSDAHGELKKSMLSRFMSEKDMEDDSYNNVVCNKCLFADKILDGSIKENLTCEVPIVNQFEFLGTYNEKETKISLKDLYEHAKNGQLIGKIKTGQHLSEANHAVSDSGHVQDTGMLR